MRLVVMFTLGTTAGFVVGVATTLIVGAIVVGRLARDPVVAADIVSDAEGSRA